MYCKCMLLLVIVFAHCEVSVAAADNPTSEQSNAASDKIRQLMKDLRSRDVKVRVKAAEGLREIGEEAAPAAKALCEALMDQSPQVAAAALEAIQTVRPKLYKPLSTMILDRDASKQVAAIEEIGLLGEDAAPAVPVLIGKLRKELAAGGLGRGNNAASHACFNALGRLRPDDQDTIKMLLTIAHPLNRNSYAKHEAINTLNLIAGESEKSRIQIIPVLKAGLADSICRLTCIKLLGEYGALAKDALPQLRQLKISEEEVVRDAANVAVDMIENPRN